jgi:cobalt/nickel transport system permease protein
MRIFQLAPGNSPLRRLDPRTRVLGALGLALTVVLVNRWSALAAAAGISLVVVGAARTWNGMTLRRLGELSVFTLFLCVFVPLSVPGAPWVEAGPLAWSGAGLAFALRIGIKATAVMLLTGALLAAMEPSDLCHALYRLGTPSRLAQILFFCVRYLDVLHVEYHRLRHAMRLRAFRPALRPHALRSLGYLVGMLFLRSIDRSERILEAMQCRGFDGRLYALAVTTPGRADAVFAAAALAAGGGILFLEWGI